MANGTVAHIGLIGITSGTSFSWSDNTPTNFTNWAQGQPTGAGQCGTVILSSLFENCFNWDKIWFPHSISHNVVALTWNFTRRWAQKCRIVFCGSLKHVSKVSFTWTTRESEVCGSTISETGPFRLVQLFLGRGSRISWKKWEFRASLAFTNSASYSFKKH